MNIYSPLNTGQAVVSTHPSGPGYWNGRNVIGTQPSGSGFSSIELEEQYNAALQTHTECKNTEVKGENKFLVLFSKSKEQESEELHQLKIIKRKPFLIFSDRKSQKGKYF